MGLRLRHDADRARQAPRDSSAGVDTVLGNQAKIVKLAESTCTTSKGFRRTIQEALDAIDDALSS